jgi:glycosyltransferase involved in cell wall biosynthesis
VPKVSIVMPTFNNDIYLQASIESILFQSYGDFEFIIIDDGSTDLTPTMLAMVKDPRVKIIRHESQLGLIASLNDGLYVAKGEYVARMDADDISFTDRLMLQVGFLEAHPHIDLCGTGMILSRQNNLKMNPQTHEEIRTWLLFHTCISHPTVMIRRSTVNRLQLSYNPAFPYAEDYELWNRIAPYVQMANLPQPLLYYRQHTGQVSQSFRDIQELSARRVRERQFSYIGVYPTEEEYQTHMDLVQFKINAHDYESYSRAARWAEKLLHHNSLNPYYNQDMLNIALSRCISNIPY